MNANELADKLMSSLTMEYDCDEYMEQAATMLRQQQAEIDTYRLQNSSQIDTHRYKPVAWMDYLEHSDVYDLNVSGRGIPLYTHSDQIGLAESIIKQQELRILELEKEVKLWQEQAVAHRAELGFKWTGEIRTWNQE